MNIPYLFISFYLISSDVWNSYSRYLKVTLTVLVLIALAAVVKKVNPLDLLKDFVDDRIYASIENSLIHQQPDKASRVKCIMGELRNRNFAAEFYTLDIVFNRHKVNAKTHAALNFANLMCIRKSPENVSELLNVLVPPIIMLILLIVVFTKLITLSLIKLRKILSGRRVRISVFSN